MFAESAASSHPYHQATGAEAAAASSEVVELPLPPARGPGARMGVAWSSLGAVLTLYNASTNAATSGSAAAAASASASASDPVEYRWATDFHDNATLRRLAAESHRIFVTCQRLGDAELGPETREAYLRCSKEYRALMHDCAAELCADAQKPGGGVALDEAAFMENQSQVLATCQILWHLIEILWVAPIYHGAASPQTLIELLDWARLHSDEPDGWIAELLNSSEVATPERHPRFWDSVYLLVLQGRTVDARNLLAQHSQASRKQQLKDAMELLNMPKYSFVRSSQSVREFDVVHCLWQKDVRVRLEAGLFSTDPELELLVELLAGDEDAFTRPGIVGLCGSWYQVLLARLFLTNPTGSLETLGREAPEAMSLFERETGSRGGLLDDMVRRLFDGQLGHFLAEAAGCLGGNWWFVGHAADLLHHCLPADCGGGGGSVGVGGGGGPAGVGGVSGGFGAIREHFLLEYAHSMLGRESLWQLAISYMDYCPGLGRHHQDAVLTRVPLDTQRKAERVYAACHSRGLLDAAATVARTVARRALASGCLGNALTWAVRARDPRLVAAIADKFLLSAGDGNGLARLASADALDCLATSALLSNRMAFLCQYKLFHDRVASGQLVEAADVAAQLLSSRMIPRRYWLSLLQDALPLLELRHQTVFTSSQVYDLMHALAELHQAGCAPPDRLAIIQASLNDALRRAMIAENFQS